MAKKKAKKKSRRAPGRQAKVRIIGAVSSRTAASISISSSAGNPQQHAAFDPSPVGNFARDFALLRRLSSPLNIPLAPTDTPRMAARRFLNRRGLRAWSMSAATIVSRWTPWGWEAPTANITAEAYELTRTANNPLLDLYRGGAGNRLGMSFYVSVEIP